MIQKMRRTLLRKRSGLTLIEMMAVALLLGILAVMAGQAVYKSIQEGRNNTVRADLRTIADAIELYSIERNTFPNNLMELVNLGYLRDEKSIVDKWAENNAPYEYCQPSRAGSGTDGMVYSVGPNGTDESDCPTDARGDEQANELYVVIRVAN